MPGRTRPIDKLATAAAKCSAESSLYGKCIFADYNNHSSLKMRMDCFVLRFVYCILHRLYNSRRFRTRYPLPTRPHSLISRSIKVALWSSCSSSAITFSLLLSGILPSTSVIMCLSTLRRSAFSNSGPWFSNAFSRPTFSGSVNTRYSIPTSSVGTSPAFFLKSCTRRMTSRARPSCSSSGYEATSRMISTSLSVLNSWSLLPESFARPRLTIRSSASSLMPSTTISPLFSAFLTLIASFLSFFPSTEKSADAENLKPLIGAISTDAAKFNDGLHALDLAFDSLVKQFLAHFWER
ncbi:conidiophore development hymA [Pyrenophora seminiperda CCB06]|uniref:Conidiophore development hymA n=1 Tax=Pyrenophora seminiperda CCB06 TaxID=1302712 RepID=A0A3M7M5T4_9PLEO|nr:conidiophore development hymA [Pyrenophora seminiperda CCB06]